MPDRTFLTWPFFDDTHRTLAADLDTWAAEHVAPLAHDESDAAATTKECVRRLGAAGWLRYAVPKKYGGAHDRLDVRSLCLIRETLARHAGLADFAFAMQGLGSGPISQFGTDALQGALPAVGGGGHVDRGLRDLGSRRRQRRRRDAHERQARRRRIRHRWREGLHLERRHRRSLRGVLSLSRRRREGVHRARWSMRRTPASR